MRGAWTFGRFVPMSPSKPPERGREGVPVEFLLSLFALLSAFTGALGGVREAEPRVHHAAAALAVAAEAPRAVAPAAVAASVSAAFVARTAIAPVEGRDFALAPAAPLDTVRLLE
jgi:hypothetical protein